MPSRTARARIRTAGAKSRGPAAHGINRCLQPLPPIETSLSRLTRGLLLAVAPTDAALHALMERAGQPLATAKGPFNDEAARRLWRAAEELSPDAGGDDALGLHLAWAATLEVLGVVGYIARASATFGEACARAMQFERLFKDGAEIFIEPDPCGARIVEIPASGCPSWPRQLTEAIMALWWLWPQRFTGVPCRPLAVRFQHPPPASTKEHERIFGGCPLEFGQPRNELVISAEVLALPLPSTDPLLQRYLEQVAHREILHLAKEDPLLRRIREKLVEMMPSGTVHVDRLARAVGLSRRTLHRRLSERSLTHKMLLDDVRRQTALRLFEARQHSFTEIAFLVGFSDPSSLRRAYRRWTRTGSAAGKRRG